MNNDTSESVVIPSQTEALFQAITLAFVSLAGAIVLLGAIGTLFWLSCQLVGWLPPNPNTSLWVFGESPMFRNVVAGIIGLVVIPFALLVFWLPYFGLIQILALTRLVRHRTKARPGGQLITPADWAHYAAAHNYKIDTASKPGTILKDLGLRLKPQLSGTAGAYPFTVFNDEVNHIQILQLEAPAATFETMVINSLIDRSIDSYVPMSLNNTQNLQLEGDFGKYVSVQVSKKRQIEALALLTPDTMLTLLENIGTADVITDGPRIYIIMAATIHASTYTNRIERARTVMAALISQVGNASTPNAKLRLKGHSFSGWIDAQLTYFMVFLLGSIVALIFLGIMLSVATSGATGAIKQALIWVGLAPFIFCIVMAIVCLNLFSYGNIVYRVIHFPFDVRRAALRRSLRNTYGTS